MQVTVLGKSPSWQDAAGACSGYLAQEQGVSVLLDCGNGVFSKLRRICDYVDVDAVVITHMHADHFLDLVPFSYALRYAPRQQPVPVAGWPGTEDPARPRLYLPAGGVEVLRHVVGCWGHDDLIDIAFDVHEYGAPRRAVARSAQRALLRGSRTTSPPSPSSWPATARGSPTAPTAAPTTSWCASPRTPTCC